MKYIIYSATENVNRCELTKDELWVLLVMISQGRNYRGEFRVRRWYPPINMFFASRNWHKLMRPIYETLDLRGITKWEKGYLTVDLSKTPFTLSNNLKVLEDDFAVAFERVHVANLLTDKFCFEYFDKQYRYELIAARRNGEGQHQC